MCGIIGVCSSPRAGELVAQGLKVLEYRGYDSWGIATVESQHITVQKDVGTVPSGVKTIGTTAIGHVRWATHGGVTKQNAHPHTDCTGEIAVVHNGIIENHEGLKEGLIGLKHVFQSQTDTEVIPHLIEEKLEQGLEFEKAVQEVCNLLDGRFAIAVIKKDENKLIGARRGSPLVAGIGENTCFLASDAMAFQKHTNKCIFLEDNEMAVIASMPRVINFKTGQQVQKQIQEVSLDMKEAGKGSYPHFLIKEIMDQRFTLRRAIEQDGEKIQRVASMINNAFGTYFVACGSAGKVAFTSTYIFSKIAKKHVNFSVGSEFPQYMDFLTPESLLVAISQSGETADTLEAIEAMKKAGGKVISIVNVMGSTMQRVSDEFIPVNAGPERAVCSTKALTGQLAVATLLAYACAGKMQEGKQKLFQTSEQVDNMLNNELIEKTRALAAQLKNFESIYVIGRGLNYPVALEASIKLQEVPYIHAEGFAGGELKHGPLALISKGTPCVALVANDEAKKDILSNAIEIKSRGGYIIGIAPENNDVFDFWIKVPDAGICSPIVNLIPIHLITYFLGVTKKVDIDRCRNLAKSVTVK